MSGMTYKQLKTILNNMKPSQLDEYVKIVDLKNKKEFQIEEPMMYELVMSSVNLFLKIDGYSNTIGGDKSLD